MCVVLGTVPARQVTKNIKEEMIGGVVLAGSSTYVGKPAGRRSGTEQLFCFRPQDLLSVFLSPFHGRQWDCDDDCFGSIYGGSGHCRRQRIGIGGEPYYKRERT